MIEVAAEVDALPEDPAAVLTALRTEQRAAQAADARTLALAVQWAAIHPAESIDHALGWPTAGAERARPIAGEGTPWVAEFCLADLAVVLGATTEGARSYLASALELAHRLPRLYERVMSGDLAAWRARRIADRTVQLPVAGAAWVDRHLAGVAHRVGPAAVERAVDDALARFDPEAAETAAAIATDGRRVDVELQPSILGTVEVHGVVDLADGLDLETALRQGAQALADLGSQLSLGQRRAKAMGEMARTQLGLALAPAPTGSGGPRPRTRKVVLHVHLSRAALDGSNEPVTVRHRGTGEVLTLAEQVRTWCNAAASVTVVPVVDLEARFVEGSYAPSVHLQRLVRLRDRHCVFPHCTRPAASCDLDHVEPYDGGGPTSSMNLAPLCRYHHRLKTHGRWSYEVLRPGRYRWRDPWGGRYVVDTGPGGGTVRGPDPPGPG